MAGLKDGFTYFRDLSNVPSTSDIVPGHKALFTLSEGVYVIDSGGNQVRLDDYQLIHDVSGALAQSISAHSAVVYRGRFDLDTSNFVYTVPHSAIVIENTTPLVTLSSPSNTSVLYVTAIRNRTTTSFDVVLSDVPNDPGYSINWLIIGEAILSGGSGGGGSFSGSASPDLLGTGTRLISAQQSILPTVSGAFDLGSANRPWRDLHLSGNTMYMNGVPIHLDGNRLKVDDLYVATTDSPDASAADLSLYATIDTVASNTAMMLGMIGTKANTTSVQTTAGNLIVLTASSSANALTQANANISTQLAGFSTLVATAAASANALTQANAFSVATSANALAQANTAIATKANDSAVVHNTGDETIAGNKSFSNTVTINGNLVVNGGTTSVTSQNVLASSNLIVVNNGGVKPIAAGFAGMEVQRGANLDDAYLFVYEESRAGFTVGLSGQTQLVATRENTPIVAGIGYWDGSNYRFNTNSALTSASLATAQTQAARADAAVGYLASVTGGFALTSSLANYTTLAATTALTGQLVRNTGNEFISGNKTFTDSVVISSGSLITSIYPANITFTRPSAISYIDINGVGGGFRLRTSNASSLDTVAMDIAANGTATFAAGVGIYNGTLALGPNPYTPAIGDLGVSRSSTAGAIYFGNDAYRYLYYHDDSISFRTPSTGTMDWNGNIIAFDSAIKNNGRVTYTVQTGSFVDPGGTDGDIVYVV